MTVMFAEAQSGSISSPVEDVADQIAAMEPELMKAGLHWTDGRRADAEDLVQDTLLRALRYKHNFRPEERPNIPVPQQLKAWLLTLMRHTFYDQGKKKVPTESLDKMLDDSELGSNLSLIGALRATDDTEAAALAAATIDETMETIESDMPAYYEKVVRLVFVEGCTYQEAAEELHIPLGTAMSAVFRARRRLGLRGQKLDDVAGVA